MIKGVLLDFNGTLFFDSKYHELAWQNVCEKMRGYPMTKDEIKNNTHGKNNEQIIDYITNGKLSREENKQVSLEKEKMYREMCLKDSANLKLAKGVEEFLDYLVSRHIPFTIASASIKENIDFFVETFNLSKWLDPQTIVYDDGTYPTKVEMFKQASKNIGVDIKDCLVLEDSISGITYAKECEVASIVAVNSDDYLQKYEQFDCLTKVISDFSEFPYEIL